MLSSSLVTYGNAVNLNATVTGKNPNGKVRFYDGGRLIVSKSLRKGLASIRKVFYAGFHTLTAQYSGDANNLGSTSLPVALVVAKAEQALLLLRAKPTRVVAGGRSTLNASGGTGAGIVTFEVVAQGGATCEISDKTLITGGSTGQCVVTATKVARNASYYPIMSNAFTVEVTGP